MAARQKADSIITGFEEGGEEGLPEATAMTAAATAAGGERRRILSQDPPKIRASSSSSGTCYKASELQLETEVCHHMIMKVHNIKMKDIFNKETEFFKGEIGPLHGEKKEYFEHFIAKREKEKALQLYKELKNYDHRNVLQIRAVGIIPYEDIACVAYCSIMGTLDSYFLNDQTKMCQTSWTQKIVLADECRNFLCQIAAGLDHMTSRNKGRAKQHVIDLDLQKIYVANEDKHKQSYMVKIGEITDEVGLQPDVYYNWKNFSWLLRQIMLFSATNDPFDEEILDLEAKLSLGHVRTFEEFMWHPATWDVKKRILFLRNINSDIKEAANPLQEKRLAADKTVWRDWLTTICSILPIGGPGNKQYCTSTLGLIGFMRDFFVHFEENMGQTGYPVKHPSEHTTHCSWFVLCVRFVKFSASSTDILI